jgi:dolichol kinase
MKRTLAVLGAIVSALACALLGAYVLRHYQTATGLIVGVCLELLAVAIALPTPFHAGVVALKDNLVLIVPVIVGAIAGGQRKTDPPAGEMPPAKPKEDDA